MASANREEEPIYGINLTPLVDIMLVLLIIFMVAARLDVPAAVGLELPRASTGDEAPPATLSIVVPREGALRLDGRETTTEEIEHAVRSARAQSEHAQAVVAADKDVPYQRVMSVVDVVRKGGVTKLALSVEETGS
jgi:biopolymer transport protein ExbD